MAGVGIVFLYPLGSEQASHLNKQKYIHILYKYSMYHCMFKRIPLNAHLTILALHFGRFSIRSTDDEFGSYVKISERFVTCFIRENDIFRRMVLHVKSHSVLFKGLISS